jgi:hypothetical protein
MPEAMSVTASSIRDDAVYSDRRERKRRHAENDQSEDAGGQRIPHRVLQRLDVVDGLSRIDRKEGGADRFFERSRILAGAEKQVLTEIHVLRPRNVCLHFGGPIQPELPHVADNADDGQPLQLAVKRRR